MQISWNTQVVACPHLYDVQFNFFTSDMLTALRPVMVLGPNSTEPISAEGFEIMTVTPRLKATYFHGCYKLVFTLCEEAVSA